jgi:P-type Ca2+ transporter type 2B
MFYGILLITSVLQVLIVEFGAIAFHCIEGGLPAKYWGISIAFGFGSLPVQQIINQFYTIGQHIKGHRSSRRHKREGSFTMRNVQ